MNGKQDDEMAAWPLPFWRGREFAACDIFKNCQRHSKSEQGRSWSKKFTILVAKVLHADGSYPENSLQLLVTIDDNNDAGRSLEIANSDLNRLAADVSQ